MNYLDQLFAPQNYQTPGFNPNATPNTIQFPQITPQGQNSGNLIAQLIGQASQPNAQTQDQNKGGMSTQNILTALFGSSMGIS